MKKKLGTLILTPGIRAAAVLLALCAFTTVSRADVIINNLGDTVDQSGSGSGFPFAQVFTMSGSDSGTVSSLTLNLNIFNNASQTITLALYNVSAGAPTGTGTVLGTFNASSFSTGSFQNIPLTLSSNPNLAAGASYAIAIEIPNSGTVSWNGTLTSASGGTAISPLGGIYKNSATDGSGTWSPATGFSGVDFLQMNLQVQAVPEVPITGVVMGFGAVAIALGLTLRRKLHPVA